MCSVLVVHQSCLPSTGEYQEVFLGILPYFHIYGMVPRMGISLATGSKTVTLPFLKPDLFINTVEKYKVC